jgi:hypothetical protein
LESTTEKSRTRRPYRYALDADPQEEQHNDKKMNYVEFFKKANGVVVLKNDDSASASSSQSGAGAQSESSKSLLEGERLLSSSDPGEKNR